MNPNLNQNGEKNEKENKEKEKENIEKEKGKENKDNEKEKNEKEKNEKEKNEKEKKNIDNEKDLPKNENENELLNKEILNEEKPKENIEKEKDLSIMPTFDEFITLSYEEFGVNCNKSISKFFSNNLYICSLKIYSKNKFNLEIKVQKKVLDFERLYKLLNSKYSKMNFQPFPNSFLTKEEELINYFDNLLNTIIRTAKDNEEMKIIFLKFIYDFFISEQNKEIISPIQPEIIKNMFSKEQSSVLKTPKKNKKYKSKLSNDSANSSNKSENKKQKIFDDNIIMIENIWENLKIKITDEKEFNGYIKIIYQCLFINKNQLLSNIEEDFDFVIPLYKINMDITKITYNNNEQKTIRYSKPITANEIYDLFYSDLPVSNIKLSEINIGILFDLYHNYSKYHIKILFQADKTLSQVKNFLEFIENSSFNNESSPYIKTIDEKYTNIYGLLYLKIDSLQITEFRGECFIKITNLPYYFSTTKLMNPDNILNNIYHLNQIFILPIHNRFGKLKFEIYQDVFKGVLIKSKEKEVIYEATIELTKILNEFNNRDIKIHLVFNSIVKTQSVKKKKSVLYEDEVEKENKIRTNLYITIKDYCNPFVLLEKSRNKNILEDSETGDDNLGIKILLKRLNKIFYLFEELNLLYKSIFRFKYPIFSLLCMIFFLGNLYFIQSKYIFNLLVMLLIIILISQCKMYKNYLEQYVNKYIFWYKNPYDLKSMIITTKKEVEDRELKNPNYLIEKEEFNLSDIIAPLTNYNKYKLKYFGFLLKITKYVGTVEKIKNLFLWTDPKLTIYFLILLIMIYLIIFKVDFKYILIFSMTKKFITGFFYYRNKYHNNIEIGRILLEHSVKKWREKNRKDSNKFQGLLDNIDLSTTRAYDNNFRAIISDIFEKNSNAVLSDTIFNIINSLKDMQNEIGKCEGVLKIYKSSPLYQFIKNNSKILSKEIEPEDYFYYFVQNIKSDFYILRNKEKDYNNYSIVNDIEGKYLSLSSDSFFKKNNNENESNEKNKEDLKENDNKKKVE